MYPLVLVLVLRKQQMRKSGIVLAEHEQNKPMYEGIVLATWNEKWITVGTERHNGEKLTKTKLLKSELTPGDHVIFHHWAGMPIHGFDDTRFRVVRERDWHETQQGGIIGTIEYSEPQNDPLQTLIQEIAATNEGEWPLVAAKLRDRFVVVDRETSAVTLSGA
jgi:co-chaperonin GroES (HSP10)